MNKIFIKDIFINNENWKIFTISKKQSLNYFKYSNKNNILSKELSLPNTKLNNCNLY